MNASFRLILDGAYPASLNMAIDEVLMESQKSPKSLPTLRFYSWSEPCYSLGYFQDVDSVARTFGPAAKRMTIVRRLTGGGLVKHGEDLTFSLTFKNPNPYLPKDAKTSYFKINEALAAGLRKYFPTISLADCKTVPSGRGGVSRVCFESPSCYDLLLEGKKVVGSSQRRQEGALLHQATIFIREKKEKLIEAVREGFESQWGIRFVSLPLADKEILLAKKREEERYHSPEWALAN